MFKAVFPAPLRLQSAGHHMCVKDFAVSKTAIATIFDYHLTALWLSNSWFQLTGSEWLAVYPDFITTLLDDNMGWGKG